jgi:two-component system chemotaxis sensor kinase CheA
MDEFIEQFLIESRELVDQGIEDLLALEKSPHDAERFDNAFRAFHTLKGGAGIVEFAAMEHAVHCVEDLLTAARSGSVPLSTDDIGNCLLCLDQVGEWLDVIQSTGALPVNADASAIVARFARPDTRATGTAPTSAAGTGKWLEALLAAHGDVAARARTAIRYRPSPDSFFHHRDPVAMMAALPGLLAIDFAPRDPWPPLEDFDPFACNLVIAALISASPDDVAMTLGDEIRDCDVESLDGRTAAAGESPLLQQQADELLRAQLALLTDAGERPEAGRIASAGIVAANVLRHIGRTAEAERIAAIAATSTADGTAESLRQAIAATLEHAVPHAATHPATPSRSDAAQTLRIDAARIDALVRLTGELTVAKNAIGHAVKLAQDEESALATTLKNRHAALDRLVVELQRSVLGMRVLPLRVAFRRFPRLIREMSVELRKPAALVVEGEDTEADKAIVEILVEPLLHVLRNAMDHGIEPARVRAAAGKPPVATIRLRAFRQGEHVVLEVADDGGGIDVARVRQVASERGVATTDTLASMSDAQIIELIFAPGFTTATTVTEVSGRGVGMDAVRTAVHRLGGTVEVGSVAGQGTTVRFTLPFSVMMTQVMTVEAGGQVFGIPLDAVVETVRVPFKSIFPIGGTHAIVLREQTVPLVELARVLGAEPKDHGTDARSIVVVNVGGDLGAIQVDKVGERLEIMLKPLDGLLSDLPGIAGSTLLGDGGVLLVLDLAELLR